MRKTGWLIHCILGVSISCGPLVAQAAAPLCEDTSATVAENSSEKRIVVTCTDADDDLDSSTYSVVSGPTNGSISALVDAPPVLAFYAPARGYSGSDAFTFSVSDSAANSAVPARVEIDVVPLPHGGASALQGDNGCLINDLGATICDRATAGLTGIGRAVMTPDGKSIYSISIGLDVLAVINVGAGGVLSQFPDTRNCMSRNGTADEGMFGPMHSCQLQARLDGIQDIAVSPDNKHVYVAAMGTNAILAFAREVESTTPGALTYIGCLSANGTGGCAQGHSAALTGVAKLKVSPDGQFLYALGSTPAVISRISRNPTTGLLSQSTTTEGCFSDGTAGCSTLPGLDAAIDLVISSNGENLYTFSTQQVHTFVRDNATGTLSQPASGPNCLNADGSNGCLTGRNFAFAMERHLVISPSGSALYLITDLGIAILARSEDGLLSQRAGAEGCINDSGSNGCAQHDYGHMFTRGAISPDARTLYAIHRRFDVDQRMLVGFSISPSTSALTPLPAPFGCVSGLGDCVVTPHHIWAGSTDIFFSPSGEHLYATAVDDVNGFFSFAVNRAPTCENTTVSTPGVVTIPIQCADTDGDAITIRVVAPPSHGTIEAVHQDTSRVVYRPSSGWHGPDSFTVAASDGAEGEASAIEVNVLAPTPTATPVTPTPTIAPTVATATPTPRMTTSPTPTPTPSATPSPQPTPPDSTATAIPEPTRPPATPTRAPTVEPGQRFEVRGFVFYMGAPVAQALVTCESLGAVLTENDGSFNCGPSTKPVTVSITKPSYTFPPLIMANTAAPLEVEATDAAPVPAQCQRKEFLAEKLALHNALLALTADAGNARRLLSGNSVLKAPRAVQVSGAAYAAYTRALSALRELPDFNDTCPTGTSCEARHVASFRRTFALNAARIRKHALGTLQRVIVRHESLTGEAASLHRAIARHEARLTAGLRHLPSRAKQCG